MSNNTNDNLKKHNRIRTWFQAAWFVLTNGYIRGYTKGMIYTGPTKAVCLPGLNCYSCPGALGSCPMGALQAVIGDTSYRVSLYVFGFLAAMGVLFGRFICGWMCPFGLFQDLMYKIKVKAKKKNLPGHKYLKYLRYVILIVFPLLLTSFMLDVTGSSMPWFCEWICPSGMLLGAIPLVTVNAGIRAAAGFRFLWKLFILLAVTAVSVWYYRPFCKYLCPLGAVYGIFNPISSYRLVIDTDKCISCGSCQRTCGMDIKTFETPNSPDCIRCGNCMKTCPTNAIGSTWGHTAQKLKDRWVVDDVKDQKALDEIAAGLAPDGLIPQTGRATFFGILMLLGSALSIVTTVFLGLYTSFTDRLLLATMTTSAPGDWLLEGFWLAAALIILMTAVYTLRYRKNPEKLLYVHEKAVIAEALMLTGLVLCIICLIINVNVIGLMFNYLLMGAYPFLAIPVIMIMSNMLRKSILKHRIDKIRWTLMSLILIAVTIYPLAVTAIFHFTSE